MTSIAGPSTKHDRLLYHAQTAPLYPTNVNGENLLTIRFPSPVRIASIRIVPEGVACPGGVGETIPSTWTGRLYLNVSTADPINALSSTEIDVYPAGHALEYPIDMPAGVSTRMISLACPADIVTISIYGQTPDLSSPQPPQEPKTHLNTITSITKVREDTSWMTAWAGGLPGLLDLIGSLSTFESVRQRAIGCLDLLVDSQEVIDKVMDHPSAGEKILLHSPSSSIGKAILSHQTLLDHQNLRGAVPIDHPLYALANASPESQRSEAWKALYAGQAPLRILAASPAEDLQDVGYGRERSNLVDLMDLAKDLAGKDDRESIDSLELVLDILQRKPRDLTIDQYLARELPRILVTSRTHGSQRPLELPEAFADTIGVSLLQVSSEIIHGQLAFPYARILMEPYLPHINAEHPVHRIFTDQSSPSVRSPAFPDTADGRRLTRLSQAITTGTQNSLVHSVTPAELLSIIAPELLATLANAPIPVLDIPSSIPDYTPESQASAWAGKVYSEHQFRTRENVGLGINGVVPRLSRPASRHVDEYARTMQTGGA